MPDDVLIVLTGDKGGVGKSTIAVLITEWLISTGVKVKLIDADPNQTMQTWVDKCYQLGYQVSFPQASVTVVDTPGTVGSSLNKYILKAEIILIPYQPHVADLEVVVGWFLSVKESIQSRVLFVPNRLSRTIEQRDGMKELEAIIADEGRGTLINGLSNRPAVYPPLLNGRSENFFHHPQNQKIFLETQPLFREISKKLKGIRNEVEC